MARSFTYAICLLCCALALAGLLASLKGPLTLPYIDVESVFLLFAGALVVGALSAVNRRQAKTAASSRYEKACGKAIAAALKELRLIAVSTDRRGPFVARDVPDRLNETILDRVNATFLPLMEIARGIHACEPRSGVKWIRKVEECQDGVLAAFECLEVAYRAGDRLRIAYSLHNFTHVVNRKAAQLETLACHTKRDRRFLSALPV